ncbi:MAG: response regulator transcription factor [Acidobacteriales bacterium]|nr:response regulator transcription factor [Terriglobales bacterium]
MPSSNYAGNDKAELSPQRPGVTYSLVLGGACVDGEGVTALLAKRPGVTAVFRTSGSFSTILQECRRLAPAVLLIDQATVESASPLELNALLDVRGDVRALVELRSGEPEATVERLLLTGCAGFLPEGAPQAILLQAIRAVADGEYWVSRKVLSRIIRSLLPVSGSRLTSREREILTLIGQGFRNQEIADRLFISCETTRWHIRSLYNKIGVHDRLAAAVYARSRQGFPSVADGSR